MDTHSKTHRFAPPQKVQVTSFECRITKVTVAYFATSLRNGGKKQKKQFERLSKSDKREWREALQRNIASLKSRLASRVLTGMKLRGKTMYRWKKLTSLEESLLENIDESAFESAASSAVPEVSFQGWGENVARTAGVVAASAIAVQASSTLSKASQLMQDSSAAVQQGKSALESFVGSIHNFMDTIKRYGDVLWKPCLIALAVWIMKRFAHVNVLVAAVIATIGAYLPEIKDMLANFVPKGFHLQNDATGVVSDIFCMICTCWVPGRDTKSVSGEFMKRVSNFPRASEGMETFIKKILGLVEDFLNFILRKTDESRITLTGKLNAFTQWRNQVIEKVKYMAQNPTMPIAEIRKIKDLQITGLGFYEVLVTNESKRELNYWMEKLSLALAPHEGAIHAENNMRAMPYCIIMGGESGAGKTTLLRYIASSILMLSGECTVKDALENMWQKGSTEYWNGYIGQKCLVMDDCFQVRGKPGDMDSEAMQMIRGIGNWSYPLNFADLPNKGKIYLDSPLVVGTTNCKNIHAEWAPFITEPKALTRRFQTSVWVRVNPEYRNDEGKFDFHRINGMFAEAIQRVSEEAVKRKEAGDPLTPGEVLDFLPWHVWDLHPHGFDRETISEAVLPGGLRGVVETAAREIKSRKAGNREEVADISKLLEVLGEAMELQTQAGGSHRYSDGESVSSFKPDDDAAVRIASMPDLGLDLPPCPTVESHDFEHRDRQGTNLERAGMHYAALVAEKEHTHTCSALFSVYKRWHDALMNKIESFGIPPEIVVGLAAGAIIGVVLRLVIEIVKGLVASLSALFKCILGAFGIRGKVESEEKPEKEKHMYIPTFNETDVVNPQVGVPPNHMIYDHIYANTLKCSTPEAEVGQFIGIGEDVYLFPKHFINALEKEDRNLLLTFHSAKDGCKGTMTVSAFLSLRRETMKDCDIAAVSFGMSFFKASKQILKYFLTQHEVKNVVRGGNYSVRLDVAQLKRDKLVQHTMYSPTCYYHGKAVDSATQEELNGLVRYCMPTISGDCGAPLTLSENRYYGGRCIVGFHSAGRDNVNGREGYSTIVTQEVARELYNKLRTYRELPYAEEVAGVRPLSGAARVETQAALEKVGINAGSFELIGVLDEPVNMPTKTKLKVSDFGKDEVFGKCPMAPAVLRPAEVDGELRDPMIQGLKAYQTPLEYKDVESLMPIVDLAMQKHWEATKHYPRDILSFEEAVVGPEGWKLKPINRKTSPGYKFASYVSPKYPGKTAFFGHEGEYQFDYTQGTPLEHLCREVAKIVECAGEGVRHFHLCTDFLKDELRPMAKVEAVATRVISGTPLDYTIAVRMYFGAYMAAMFKTFVDNGMAPGINQYTQWYTLVTALRSVSNKVFDGDFSRFDASEQPWVHEGQLRYINKWYRHNNPSWEPIHDRVRCILWLDLVHSRHITGTGNSLRYVVQWSKSLPSGHPLTTVVNSMYSLITLTGCYMRTTGDHTDMWKHACIVTFGDDNINSVDDEMCDRFNQVTVAECMHVMFGLTYTPGNKSGVLVPYTTLENTTFLKRSFKEDDTIGNSLLCTVPGLGWVGPLAEESFLYVPYWYKNSRTPVQEMITRTEQALCEMCLHPQELWDAYFPLVEEWCTRNNVPLKLTSRQATRLFIENRLDVWF